MNATNMNWSKETDSSKSISPLPSLSTSLIIPASSSLVGACPNVRITDSNSWIVIYPTKEHSLNMIERAEDRCLRRKVRTIIVLVKEAKGVAKLRDLFLCQLVLRVLFLDIQIRIHERRVWQEEAGKGSKKGSELCSIPRVWKDKELGRWAIIVKNTR